MSAQAAVGGPEHFAGAAALLGAPLTQQGSWEGVTTQKFLPPPGGWSHPGSSFARITVPLAQPGRVRRKLPGVASEWLPGLKRQGTISLTPPGAEGEWEWLDVSSFGLLYLPERLLADAIDDAGLSALRPSLRPVFAEPDDVIGSVFQAVCDEIVHEGRQSRLLVSSAALFLARYIVRRYGAPEERGADHTPLDDLRLKRVVEAIEARLDHDWSIDEMAQEAGLSPGRFAHAFKDKLGVSPRAFVQHRRLTCAKRMLSLDTLSIAQVAAHCGFESQSWFTTCFKRAFGVSPGVNRRLAK